jgi:hypothetical protein
MGYVKFGNSFSVFDLVVETNDLEHVMRVCKIFNMAIRRDKFQFHAMNMVNAQQMSKTRSEIPLCFCC